jgi:hypothetical protein
MKPPGMERLGTKLKEMEELYVSIWLCFIAGMMLAFALGYLLGSLRGH